MGKDRVKVFFECTIKKVTNLAENLNGSTLYIEWRRGARNNSGMTKRALVRDREAQWGESINFECTFMRDSTTHLFDRKHVVFTLKEVSTSEFYISWFLTV